MKKKFKFQKKTQRYKKQNGNFTTKKYKNRNENAIDGLKQQNAKYRGEKSVKLFTVNNRKKIHLKNMERDSGACGIITKELIFMSLGSQKERRKGVGLKNYSPKTGR